MATLPYRCRGCTEPTCHRDSFGPLCSWCEVEALHCLGMKETEQLAEAAVTNATRPRWAGRAFANIAPRNLEGVRLW